MRLGFFRFLSGLRDIQGVSLEDAAEHLNISPERLKLVEEGKAGVPPELLVRYASLLRISPEEILLHHLNDYASDFVNRSGFKATVVVQLKFTEGDEQCGMWHEIENLSRYERNRARLSQQWEQGT